MILKSKATFLLKRSKFIPLRVLGQSAFLPALLCLTLAACGGPSRPVGVIGHIDGYGGMIAADEPHAVLVGRDVLSAGGSPADAAVAMAMTMAVAYPSDISLGAGGACLVYDRDKNKVEALNFIAPAAQSAALPALTRGLYALHSRYGLLRWEQLLGPAENMARTGFPASRALAQRMMPMKTRLQQDSVMKQIFLYEDGNTIREGDIIVQPALGAVISRIRNGGVGDFYARGWANAIVSAYNNSGGAIDTQSLSNFTPQWNTPISVSYGNETAYFSPLPAINGMIAAQYWAMLANNSGYKDQQSRNSVMEAAFANGETDRASWLNADGTSRKPIEHLLDSARLAQIAKGRFDAPPPGMRYQQSYFSEEPSGTGLVVMDQEGNAVTCSFGLNASFGMGHIARNTGIVMAKAAGSDGVGPISQGVMLAVNSKSNEFRFAAAGGGNFSLAPTMVSVALDSLIVEKPLKQAMNDGRSTYSTPSSVRLNALRCKSGTPGRERCEVETDPHGYGLSVIVDE